MRRLFWFLAFCLLAGAAQAQTTFVSGDCNANVAITGGALTLTSTQAGNFAGCRASQAKQSGSSYFEFTVNHAPVATVFGVAGGGSGTIMPSIVTYWSTATGYTTGNNFQAAVIRQDGTQYWNNVSVGGGTALASTKTGAIALNMDTDPWQMWVTSDVTSLICNGTGGSGSTAPQWNGSCADDPTLIGTGNPINVFPSSHSPGTGAQFYIPGGAVFPIWQGQVLDSATFNFGTYVSPTSCTGFVGTAPTGYHCWNDPRGNPVYPGPFNPMQVHVSNAPGFLISNSYISGDRVNAGAGWDGSNYTSGLPVCIFGLVTPGTSGTDPTVFNTACASGTPSNTGGIPGGSWPGATTVTSGGATFALLKRIDYVTLTHAFADAPAWTPSTEYPGYMYVQNGGIAYSQFNPFGVLATCTSGSGSGPPASDGDCQWTAVGRMTYSSLVNQWPHMKYFGGNSQQYNYSVAITMWYGGKEQQIYGPQQPGEGLSGGSAIVMAFHFDLPSDQDFSCLGAYGTGASRNTGCPAWVWTLTAAPGDSFTDNFTTSTPLRIDQTKGVTVTNTVAYSGTSFWNGYEAGEPIAFSDNNGIVSGLQLFSLHGTTIPAHGGGGNGLFPGNGHTNGLTIEDSLLQSGPDGYGVFFCDGGCALLNDVVMNGSTVTGTEGVEFGYGQAVMANVTVVGIGTTNSSGVLNQANFGASQHLTFYNNLVLKFDFPWATSTSEVGTWLTPDYAATNATDSPASGYGGTFTAPANSIAATSGQMPGVDTSSGCGAGLAFPCSGLTAANQLVSPTIGASFDARIKPGADIIGAGANFSTIQQGLADASSPTAVSDIINQLWLPRWDVGPEKFFTVGPNLLGLRGWMLRR